MRRRAKERERERERQKIEKGRAILKRLLAAVVQGQHGEKMVCVKKMPMAIRTLGKANSHFDPTQLGSGTASPR